MSRLLRALRALPVLRTLALALLLTGPLASAPLALAVTQNPEAGPGGQAAPSESATGAHHGEHGVDVKTLGLQLLNFALLIFILVKYAGGAMRKALRERHEQLRTSIDEAARVKTAAEERFRQQEQRLANLEHELEAMRRNIIAEAESEKARLLAAAGEKARRIQEETRFQLDQQVKDAELRFKAAVAEAAVKIADELVRRSVTPSDEQRLAHTFVSELTGGNGDAARGGPPGGDGGAGADRPAPRPRPEGEAV